jgi:hypothetical protein
MRLVVKNAAIDFVADKYNLEKMSNEKRLAIVSDLLTNGKWASAPISEQNVSNEPSVLLCSYLCLQN